MTRKLDTASQALPSALLAAAAVGLGWQAHGSTASADWLPSACGAALLAAVVLWAGAARPARPAAAAVLALAGLAVWIFVSHWWSAAPALARDEALLTGLYAVALLLPLVTLRTPTARMAALGTVAAATAGLAAAIAVDLLLSGHPAHRFVEGRLAYPISYINAQAAAFALGWWPAIGLAAHRRLPAAVRILALGAAALCGAAALMCQSKGTELGLGLSILVVAALSGGRLRLLLPTAIAALVDAAAIVPLTEPYRHAGDPAARHAAVAALAAGVAGSLLGAVYVVLDRRTQLSERATRAAGAAVAAGAALAAAAAVLALLLVPAHPVGWLQDRWHAFKTPPATETASSHLLSLGSYRYDTWRVAFGEWRAHPVAGLGARGCGPAYLVKRHIARTPQHAHSLELETMSDEGAIGFVLLVVGIGAPFALAVARARKRVLPSAVAVGACSAWLLQASADWLWSFPAIGIPFFLLLGIGASGAGPGVPVSRRVRLAAAAVCGAAFLLAFVPPWLASRLVTNARTSPGSAATDLRWARRLDPLSTQVLVMEAARASTYADQVRALETAVRMEPRQAAMHYLLGVVQLNGGDRKAARAQLERALALDPGDPVVEAALGMAKSAR